MNSFHGIQIEKCNSVMTKFEMMFVNLLPILFLIGVSATTERELPKYLKRCSMKHNLRECVIDSANNAIPFIVKGDPKFNVPNMLPFHVSFISLINTRQLVLNLTNLEIHGLSEARMVDFIEDPKLNQHFNLVLSVPNATIKGEYSVSGQVLVLPIKGVGNFSITLSNAIFQYFHELKVISTKGEDYYQSQGKDLKFSFENFSINLGNLFNGDEALGDQINKVLNENWNTLLSEFGPGISKIVLEIIENLFNGIARKVPAKNVFLPD